jgi:hypothetical protein
MSTPESDVTFVRINRLTNTWTWNVSVVANDNTAEQLGEAKKLALRIAGEIQDELLPAVDEAEEAEVEAEVAF